MHGFLDKMYPHMHHIPLRAENGIVQHFYKYLFICFIGLVEILRGCRGGAMFHRGGQVGADFRKLGGEKKGTSRVKKEGKHTKIKKIITNY